MVYLSEFVGALIFLVGGYAYMCNVTLKKTLIGKLNYIELTVAWSLAVGFALTVAVIMGGPALLNPGAVLGNLIIGSITAKEALLFLLMEFAGAGAAVLIVMIFFFDSFKESEDGQFRGIFSAYPVKKNLCLNFIQEVLATFFFLFLVLVTIKATSEPIVIGIVGFAAVAILALTLNSTGFSMNAMRSFFSSIWYAILPIPNKKDKVDWVYQIVVNLVASTIGGACATIVASLINFG